jgi:succinyl-diaminopimelate desuccinylase
MIETRAAELAQLVNGDEVVRLAQALVRIDSVAAPGRPYEADVVRFLVQYLEAHGFQTRVAEVAPKRQNLMVEWDSGYPGKLLLLEGHTDVVFEGDRSSWTRDPFSGDLEDGCLWGRGSADMKGGLAAAIIALTTVKNHARDLTGSVRLLIPCDEEGMMMGIKRMVSDGWAFKFDGSPADGAIICEPEENELCLWQRGGIRIAIRFHGKQAHGAMPYAGINPIPWLARTVLELRELEKVLKLETGFHEMLGFPSITPTVLEAGSLPQLNVMPGEALLALDIRTVPGVDHQQLHARIKDILQKLETEETDFKASIEIIDDRPWTATDPNSSIVKALEAAQPFSLARAPRYGGVPGTTDGTFLHKAGVPIVTVGPGDREIPHQVNEFVRLEELVQSARLYVGAIAIFLSNEYAVT